MDRAEVIRHPLRVVEADHATRAGGSEHRIGVTLQIDVRGAGGAAEERGAAALVPVPTPAVTLASNGDHHRPGRPLDGRGDVEVGGEVEAQLDGVDSRIDRFVGLRKRLDYDPGSGHAPGCPASAGGSS